MRVLESLETMISLTALYIPDTVLLHYLVYHNYADGVFVGWIGGILDAAPTYMGLFRSYPSPSTLVLPTHGSQQ